MRREKEAFTRLIKERGVSLLPNVNLIYFSLLCRVCLLLLQRRERLLQETIL